MNSTTEVDANGIIVSFGAVGKIKTAGQIHIPLPIPPPVLLTQELLGTNIGLTWERRLKHHLPGGVQR